ncbi:MAG TPA: hypothetical protein VMN79_06755 [Casimicrobiaceae bacterium]|nr:hypothetical protein [Casimicrobiaceae bacterium]
MSALPAARAPQIRGWMLWLAPAIVLALVVGLETDWGRQVVRVPSTPPPVEPKPVSVAALPDYQIEGGLAAHSETVQRTLFNATRRPAPALASNEGPKQIVHGKFQLTGTTVTAGRNVAFLKEVAGGKTRVVSQGDEIDGMKVALVTPGLVRFTAGGDSEDLILKVAPGPKTTIAAAPPRPAPPGGAPAGGPTAARPTLRPAQAPGTTTPAAPAQSARAARRAGRAVDAGAGAQQDGSNQQSDGGFRNFRQRFSK